MTGRPDRVCVICASCLEEFDVAVVPTSELMCARCGAVLAPLLVTIVYRVETMVRATPPDRDATITGRRRRGE